jgi:tRNA nucleotidyltransferase (CCA-adding enzyme)
MNLHASLQNLFPADSHEHIFLVGGSVRDFLLDRASQDIDLVAALSSEKFRECGFRRVEGKTTTAIWFRFDPRLGKIEVIQLEDEVTLGDDLARRDFTMNAIAMSLAGEIHDPLQGQRDLRNGLLRACSPRAFSDDPLRVFRAFRFEAEGWRMTAETGELIRRDDLSLKLRAIPTERFSREMLKALAGKEPERFFQLMIEFGAGRDWLPELFHMPQIPAGPVEHHPEGDLFTHSVQVLQRAASQSSDPLARFCAFFHDLGKLATDPAQYPKHHGHEETGFDLAVAFCNRLCLPVVYRKALSWTSRLHMRLNKWDELRDSTKIKTAEQAAKAGIADILPLVSAADKPGAEIPRGWRHALSVAAMTTVELGIDIERLTAIPAESRPDFILQRRIEALRRRYRSQRRQDSEAEYEK